jgi:hypothetical protein
VHRKKDATDWGVKPQVPVPVDAEQEKRAFEARMEQEFVQRPKAKATTAAVTQPSTQATDLQLQRAVDIMMAWLIFGGGSEFTPQFATTEPTTKTVASAAAPTTNTIQAAPPATRIAPDVPREMKPRPSTRPSTPRTAPEILPKTQPTTAP